MNRRGFFSVLAGGLAVATDPERLLWTPGKRLISIPPPHGNIFLTQEMLAEELLSSFRENLQFLGEFPKIGDTLIVRRPRLFYPNRLSHA